MRGQDEMDALEGLIREHFRAETWHLRAGPRLWAAVEARLGQSSREAAPAYRRSPRRAAGRYLVLVGGAAAVAVAVWVAANAGRQARPPVVAMASPTAGAVAPASPTASAPASPTRLRATLPTPAPTAVPTAAPGPSPASGAVVVPRLNVGTLEEAQQAVGVTVRLPRYLPPGARREDEGVHYYVHQGRGMVSLAYRVGSGSLALEYHRLPSGESLRRDGQPATVGGHSALVHTQAREPSDPLPPVSEVVWQDGETTVRVTGDLPVAELLRVAESMY